MSGLASSLRRLTRLPQHSRFRDYGIAVLSGLFALLVLAAIDPYSSTDQLYVFSLAAVVFVSWRCGFGPGIVTLGLTMAGTIYFFVPPRNSLVIGELRDQIAAVLFLLCGVGCAALGGAHRVSRARATSALGSALDWQAELESEVSRREKAEDSLRQSEVTLRAFYDSAPVGMGAVELLDNDVLHLYDNAASCRFYGKEPGATAGRLESELGTPPEVLEQWLAKYRESAETGTATRFEYRYELAGGERWLTATVSPVGVSARGKQLFCYIAEDTTARRQAEDAIRESQLRFRSMADSLPGLVWLSNRDRQRTYFNKTWLDFTGRSIEHELGDGWVDSIHPGDRELYLSTYNSAFESRQPFEIEYRLHRHDDVYRWVLARGMPRFHPSGAFAGFVGFCLDVTDRRNAAEYLRRSEQRFRTLTEAIPQMIWNAGPDGRLSYSNERWRNFTGLPTESGQTVEWFEAAHPNDRERIREAWRSTVDSAGSDRPVHFSEELRLRNGETGEYRWFLAIAVPLDSHDGAVDQWIGAVADIHDQKTASAVVAESEEKFRTMAESIPQLAWMADADGYIFWYNQRWYEFTGTSFDEVRGWGWQQLHDPAELPRIVEKFKAHIVSGEPWEDTFALRRHDGAMRWHLSRARPIRDKTGRVVRWFGTNTDITDQRELEQKLRAAVERFRTLTEAVSQMVWTATPFGEVTFFNKRWHEYTGLSLEGATTVSWRDAVHPDDADLLQKEWQHAATNEAAPFTSEFRLRRGSDGEYRWMLSTAVPLRDSTGALNEWVGSITDIDDQKRQSETLERMVHDRTAALVDEIQDRTRAEQQAREAAAELERSNRELQEFAYIASHDLQEPLRKIQAFGDRLRHRFRDALPETGQDYVDRMSSSASRMRRLIDDLLNYSRVTTQALPFRRVSLNKLVKEILSDLDELITQHQATVKLGALPTVAADATQMRQLFQNLIVNAVKFHKPGLPPVIEIASERAPMPPGAAHQHSVDAWRITVKDNGIGFDEKYVDRIFQVFQRLHGRGEFEGSGVGLAICRKIVERHNGSITAHSQPGDGATFVVTLPLRGPSEDSSRELSAEQEANHDPDGG